MLNRGYKEFALGFRQEVYYMNETAVEQSIILGRIACAAVQKRKRYIRIPMGKQFDERYTLQTMKQPNVSWFGRIC